jgi:hypothetical protein
MSPPLCFGDAREGTVGDNTPLAKRSVEHTPRIKHQALSSNRPCKAEYVEISLSRALFSAVSRTEMAWSWAATIRLVTHTNWRGTIKTNHAMDVRAGQLVG